MNYRRLQWVQILALYANKNKLKKKKVYRLQATFKKKQKKKNNLICLNFIRKESTAILSPFWFASLYIYLKGVFRTYITLFIAGQLLLNKVNEHIWFSILAQSLNWTMLSFVIFHAFITVRTSARAHTHAHTRTGARQLTGNGLNSCDELRVLGMLPWLSSCSLGAQQTISLNFSAWTHQAQDQEREACKTKRKETKNLIICSVPLKQRTSVDANQKLFGKIFKAPFIQICQNSLPLHFGIIYISFLTFFMWHLLHFAMIKMPFKYFGRQCAHLGLKLNKSYTGVKLNIIKRLWIYLAFREPAPRRICWRRGWGWGCVCGGVLVWIRASGAVCLGSSPLNHCWSHSVKLTFTGLHKKINKCE